MLLLHAYSQANSSVDACGAEVVSVRCLQGLSQEGSLEGFAGRSSAAASNTALTSEDQDNAAADKTAEVRVRERVPARAAHLRCCIPVCMS